MAEHHKCYTDKPCCQMRKYIDENVLAFFNGDEEKFKLWLNTPNPQLGNVAPMKTSITTLYSFVKQQVEEEKGNKDCLGCQ